MDTVEDSKPEISESKWLSIAKSLNILFVAVIGYAIAFAYEEGYSSYFHIPFSLVSPSFNTFYLVGFHLLTVAGGIFIILVWCHNFMVKHLIKSYMFLDQIPKLSLLLTPLYTLAYSRLQLWAFTLVLISVPFIANLIARIIRRNREKKINKEDQIPPIEQNTTVTVEKYIQSRFGMNPWKIGFVLWYGYIAIRAIGYADAYQESKFYVLEGKPERVILRIYGDLLITAPFDSLHKTITSERSCLKFAKDSISTLREIEIPKGL